MCHYALHGFQAGRGTGTTALEPKLLQHLTAMREVVLFEVFLDIQKAYNVLDWEWSLELLAAYGAGPRMIRLLWKYCDRLTMEAKAGEYSRRLFKGKQGVMQGYPLSPTIFNVVVDAVIRQWVTVVMTTEAVTRGLGMKIIDLAAYLYANNHLVPSTQP